MSDPLGPGRTRVGWIGTGVMGAAMCGHVLAKGYAVTVHSRTRAKADALLAQGAVWADTPAEVAARSDALLSIVGFPADVREVWLGPKGALAALRPGALAADLTTSDPALARRARRGGAPSAASACSTRRCRAATSARAPARSRS